MLYGHVHNSREFDFLEKWNNEPPVYFQFQESSDDRMAENTGKATHFSEKID